jgi:hypothetical protein
VKLFKATEQPLPISDEELGRELREAAQRTGELRLLLAKRGWSVSVYIGSDGSNSVEIDRRLKL